MATGTGWMRARVAVEDWIVDMARTSVSGGRDDPSGLGPGLICFEEKYRTSRENRTRRILTAPKTRVFSGDFSAMAAGQNENLFRNR
jgi:hypothetical protein